MVRRVGRRERRPVLGDPGGGGNFGIVTAFHLQLHPVGPIVLGGMLAWPAAMAGDVVRFYRDFMADAPDEFGSALAFITAPPAEFVPEPVRGQPVVGMRRLLRRVDLDDGEQVLAPLREFGPPAVDLLGPMPYLAVQDLSTPPTRRVARNYWTADFLAELPDEAIDVLVEHATAAGLAVHLDASWSPAAARWRACPRTRRAFGQRSAPLNIHFLSMWDDPADDAANIAYTQDIAAAMKPWTTGAGLPQLHRRRGRRAASRRRSGPRSTHGSRR